MKIFGSRGDRHAPLGEGMIGMECFRYIAEDSRFDGIPPDSRNARRRALAGGDAYAEKVSPKKITPGGVAIDRMSWQPVPLTSRSRHFGCCAALTRTSSRRYVAHLLFRNGRRRRDAERRVAEQEPVAQNPRLLEKVPSCGTVSPIRPISTAIKQPAAADFAHGGCPAAAFRTARPWLRPAPRPCCPAGQRRQPRRTTDRVAAEGGDMSQ